MDEVPLKENPQMSDQTDSSPGRVCIEIPPNRVQASCTTDKDHRKLAIASIICGLSCIGIMALMSSVKARMTRTLGGGADKIQHYSDRAKRLAIISIVVWALVLTLTPALLALVSYLITLKD